MTGNHVTECDPSDPVVYLLERNDSDGSNGTDQGRYNFTSLEIYDGAIRHDDVTIGSEVVIISIVLAVIIFSAVVGNLLVIISVLRFDKLRIMANAFIVSLAFADLLVAILVMPFSASQEIAGRWLFSRVMCDIFNANDVLFSTASLLHLCCISMDRYIAITDPFNYEERMTKRRAGVTLGCAWAASALLSHIPIHLKLYSASSDVATEESDLECSFNVNWYYGIISSAVSFWTPAIVMVFTYEKIYREARRQEKQIASISFNNSSTTTVSTAVEGYNSRSGPASGGKKDVSRISTPDRRQMKREHKAAKTLGMIMGAFLVCWLPFFTWYLTDSICQDLCNPPKVLISALFWVGYTNSALNPVIYACFNRDFRNAFRKLLGCGVSYPYGVPNSERTHLKPNSTELHSVSSKTNMTERHSVFSKTNATDLYGVSSKNKLDDV